MHAYPQGFSRMPGDRVVYINFARPHKSLANPYPRTPAMAAGVADHIWSLEEIARAAGLAQSDLATGRLGRTVEGFAADP